MGLDRKKNGVVFSLIIRTYAGSPGLVDVINRLIFRRQTLQTHCRHDIMNRFFSISLWALLIILCLVGTGSAQTTWHVATNGADTGCDGLSRAQAFLTISNAVTNASSVTPDPAFVNPAVNDYR